LIGDVLRRELPSKALCLINRYNRRRRRGRRRKQLLDDVKETIGYGNSKRKH